MADVITLGATYRDVVSNFEGIATSKTEFMFACERVALSQGHNDKGEDISAVFDATQLVLVKPPTDEVQRAIDGDKATRRVPVHTGGDRPMRSAER